VGFFFASDLNHHKTSDYCSWRRGGIELTTLAPLGERTATGAFSSRGGPGEGVPTRTSSAIRCPRAGCQRGFFGGPPVNAVALLPIPSVTRSRRSRWTRLSWAVPVVFVGFTVLTPSPVSPRLMRTPVASHPLPQGGEGCNVKSAPPSVATFANIFGSAAPHFYPLPFALCLLIFFCGFAAMGYVLTPPLAAAWRRRVSERRR
jgi:hypothetical protein